MDFRYGVEEEFLVARADGSLVDFGDVSAFSELQGIVDAMPVDDTDYSDLRVGDQGIKFKRWYVEGYERFDDDGRLTTCDAKGIEVRTAIHDSPRAAADALDADVVLLDEELSRRSLRRLVTAFNPLRSDYRPDPPWTDWERTWTRRSPEERTADICMVTYGPDLNISSPAFGPDEVVDAARKLTYLSPWLVPLSFSSPFRDGGAWGGLSARTRVRTGRRPAAMAFVAEGRPQEASDPSLTQVARIPAEVGRIEFKAFDALGDPRLTAELLSLLTGLLLDTGIDGRSTTPDTAAHRAVAGAGLDDDTVHAATGELIEAAARALAGRPSDLERVQSLRERWRSRSSRSRQLLDRVRDGDTVVDACRV